LTIVKIAHPDIARILAARGPARHTYPISCTNTTHGLTTVRAINVSIESQKIPGRCRHFFDI